ncbi:MAG: hypothetical protein CSB34_07620 [Desulfobulbus propionicus]|nr:MAG: hypothetical protein CSB34_07620 [Desulfobulbus propionicus]
MRLANRLEAVALFLYCSTQIGHRGQHRKAAQEYADGCHRPPFIGDLVSWQQAQQAERNQREENPTPKWGQVAQGFLNS